MDNGAYAFMNKPLDIDQLVTIMSRFKESGHDDPAMHDKQDRQESGSINKAIFNV